MQHQQMIRILHWGIVLCVVIVFATAYYRHWYTTQMEAANWYLLVIHMNVGALILIFTFVMLMLRFRGYIFARQEVTNKKLVASLMHSSLYIMLIVLPVSAYIGTGFDFPMLGLINLPGFIRFEFIQTFVQQTMDMLMISFIEPLGIFHRDIGADVILPTLLVGHIGAGIYHRFG